LSADALQPFLPLEQRCGHQIFAVEVKQVEAAKIQALGISKYRIRATGTSFLANISTEFSLHRPGMRLAGKSFSP
jgi:hypothetical protein